MVKNIDYLGAFIFCGFAGIGAKLILSANAKEEDDSVSLRHDVLENIPIASAILGVLLLATVNLLPDIEV